MSKKLSELFESAIEKAELVLGVKAITDEMQSMTQKISKMQIEDVSALTERLKAEFGVAVGDKFQNEVNTILTGILSTLQSGKATLDNKALELSGDSTSVPFSDEIETTLDMDNDEVNASTDDFNDEENLEDSDLVEPGLGRVKKESIIFKATKMLEHLEKTNQTQTPVYEKLNSFVNKIQLIEGTTRKHFQMAANTIKQISDLAARKKEAESYANFFKKDNPRFNKEKFMSACGVEDELTEKTLKKKS